MRPRTRLVVLTGAGISRESGLRTFRDADGLWRQYDVSQIASADALRTNPALVLEHYNHRRAEAWAAQPNAAHLALASLEDAYDVHIVTQNVDRLHERAGSTQVLHLHGDLHQARSSVDPSLVYPWEGRPIAMGDTCDQGSQLRPDVVLFGEAVPNMVAAVPVVQAADVFVVVGTSLAVYPAASLLDFVPPETPIYLVDPNGAALTARADVTLLPTTATEGVPRLCEDLRRRRARARRTP